MCWDGCFADGRTTNLTSQLCLDHMWAALHATNSLATTRKNNDLKQIFLFEEFERAWHIWVLVNRLNINQSKFFLYEFSPHFATKYASDRFQLLCFYGCRLAEMSVSNKCTLSASFSVNTNIVSEKTCQFKSFAFNQLHQPPELCWSLLLIFWGRLNEKCSHPCIMTSLFTNLQLSQLVFQVSM